MNDRLVYMENVSKEFKSEKALENIYLEIGAGNIIGLVGANGAGKSTLLRHIIGLYLPDSGSCTTFGCDAGRLSPKELSHIGYVHQEGQLLDWMTVRQHIDYVAAYYDNWNRELEGRYIDDFEIDVKKRVGAMSPGQRQKLAILLAIGHEPELLILDEPAAGLDPIARGRFLDMLLAFIQDQNRTIIISSHILSDIEKVIDYVLIMQAGRLERDCTLDELREEFCKIKLTSLNGDLPDDLTCTGLIEKQQSGPFAVMTLPADSKPELDLAAKRLKCRMDTEPLTLEELYKIVVQ